MNRVAGYCYPLLLSLCFYALACGDSRGYEDRLLGTEPGAASDSTAGQGGQGPDEAKAGTGGAAAATGECRPPVSSDVLKPRVNVIASRGTQVNGGTQVVFTTDLFGRFKSICGGCHVDQSQGNLHVNQTNFASKITDIALKRIMSDDPGFFMPPVAGGGMPFSKRGRGDPVVELAGLLQDWIAAGSPADAFTPTTASSAVSTHSFLIEPQVASQLTNIGSCIPDKSMVGSEQSHSADLDAKFETATELPGRLEQTDLTTFDSATLAREGVIAFAPGYTLWADSAKKIRMIRVPRGTSIVFDKKQQSFTLPANTRLYKTFLKRVIDIDGNESYRKIETRLIVSRPDTVNKDGSRTPNALFGTYAWNEAETEAVLVTDPLRNGKPFRDRVFSFVTDEKKADAILRSGPVDSAGHPANIQKTFEAAGVTRTYAIPGSERCNQCHMGSPNASFILGFIPLQIKRRPMGEGGVFEPAERDELNQLQRFIDYGLITGMKSPDDVLPLEASQGDRTPRNDDELRAQGYMLGNCAHCHNPHGFPSVTAPELKDVNLDFLPSKTGGIFQFPLDKFSPRIFRGPSSSTRIPYITPSLYDLGQDNYPWGKEATADKSPLVPVLPDAVGIKGYVEQKQGSTSRLLQPIAAPWRSLIYRNTDTPFSYAEDLAIFPHMPRNTPGYDCRTRKFFGTWMASIPAKLKPGADPSQAEQPYVEVKPNEREYAAAKKEAADRVMKFQASPRYACMDPSPETPGVDPVDPAIRDDPDGKLTTPEPISAGLNQDRDTSPIAYQLAVPSRPHWFVADLTDAASKIWEPRRADWKSLLVDHQESNRSGEKATVDVITLGPDGRGLRVSSNTELHDFALTEKPFGVWIDKPECKFPNVGTFGAIKEGEKQPWMANNKQAVAAAHVYSVSPGQAVFTMVCQNCHGPEANAKSRLADTIADLTGGATRVANLRDGLLGPATMPGGNRLDVFGLVAKDGLTVDDWGARYVAWMTLGGTQRVIPAAVLGVIGNGFIIGEKRPVPLGQITDANMLTLGVALCSAVLPNVNPASTTSSQLHEFDPLTGELIRVRRSEGDTNPRAKASALITWIGDAEMWQKMCTLQNALPVRLIEFAVVQGGIEFTLDEPASSNTTSSDNSPMLHFLSQRKAYGAGPVGDQSGNVQPSLTDQNLAPWCIRPPSSDALRAELTTYWNDVWLKQHPGGTSQPPICPDAALADSARLDDIVVKSWSTRGAMNAGMSAFLYLDALARGKIQRVPDFNHCEQLK